VFVRRSVIAFVLLFASAAQAAWPERPVTLVVPFAPGGITDILARLTAERLGAALKTNFVVENQVGGAGVIATERVARADPDGYTLLFSTISQIAIAPFTHKISYDPIRDFKPISIVATSPFVVTVSNSFPASTLSEFIAHVKGKPGQLAYASAGPGSLTHISSALFLKRAGLDMIHVPNRGVAPAFNDLLAGNVQMVSATPVELKPFLDSNKIKLLGSSGPVRSKDMPDVPAIAEIFPSHSVVTWNGVLAPARTSQPIIDALSREIMAAVRSPDVQARLSRLGVDPVGSTPAEFEQVIAADTERWRTIVRDMGLQTQ
jgi:tripartite-type tricarboxylate transporter receptor subunit TctC